jgi:hypothetical protein
LRIECLKKYYNHWAASDFTVLAGIKLTKWLIILQML